MRKLQIGVSILFVFTLSGCQFLWDAVNRDALKKDISSLLSLANISKADLDCHMLGTTRTGTCDSNIASGDVDELASILKLSEIRTDGIEDYNTWVNGTCAAHGTFHKILKSARRAQELRVNTSSFEYFLIFYNSQTNDVCIQVSYAYG